MHGRTKKTGRRASQKQTMALGLGVGVLAPEQESSGGVVTAEGYQMFQAEGYGEFGFYGRKNAKTRRIRRAR